MNVARRPIAASVTNGSRRVLRFPPLLDTVTMSCRVPLERPASVFERFGGGRHGGNQVGRIDEIDETDGEPGHRIDSGREAANRPSPVVSAVIEN